MPVTSVGAIYATKSKLLQRIYIPHGNDSEILQQQIHAGESIILVSMQTFEGGGAQVIQELIGAPAHNGRCKVIHKDTGEIINYIIADPEIYKHPDGHYIVLLDE